MHPLHAEVPPDGQDVDGYDDDNLPNDTFVFIGNPARRGELFVAVNRLATIMEISYMKYYG